MRWGRLDPETIARIAAAPTVRTTDGRGNLIVVGRDERGRKIRIVIALDDPGYVTTVIVKGRRR
jgi:hypothetical protein